AANVLALGPEAALTGPIARGDGDTVARHLAAIADRCPEYLPLYRARGLLTADIAEPGRPPGDDAIAHVRALLAPREPGTPLSARHPHSGARGKRCILRAIDRSSPATLAPAAPPQPRKT